MARGWESKAVESQIESAKSDGHKPGRDKRTPAELQLIRERETLMLSRTRVLRELESSQHDGYKQILRKALANLEGRIEKFDEALRNRKEAVKERAAGV